MRSIQLAILTVLSLSLGAVRGRVEAQASGGVQHKAGWKRPSDAELKKILTPIQFSVTRRNYTETPYHNAYWNNHEPGIYVDVVSGAPLFSSADKYDSHTGWPSFTRPLEPANLLTLAEATLGFSRTEVRSSLADSHLGHLFDDGPPPTGKRYCMNSAALRFVPVSMLAAEGYGKYLALFHARSARGGAMK